MKTRPSATERRRAAARRREKVRRSPGAPRPRRAFTMVELLVVMSVIMILLGIGVGVYFGVLRANALQAEKYAVVTMIQSARSTARAESSETFVCIEPEAGRIYPFGREKVGVWHFETLEDSPSRTYGALGHAALVTGGEAKLTDGKVSKALLFDGTYYLRCKMLRGAQWVQIPAYDTHEGVAIEASVAPVHSGADDMTIMSHDGWFGMSLRYDEASKKFALAAFAVVLDANEAGYLRYSASTAPVVRANEWTRVGMSCHRLGTGITLTVNGAEQDLAGSSTEAAPAPASDTETAIGAAPGGTQYFYGRIDHLIVSAYMVDTVHQISPKLALEAEGLAEGNTIRFGPSGELTAAHDGTPPRVLLKEYRGGNVVSSSVTITVGPMGALDVETWNR